MVHCLYCTYICRCIDVYIYIYHICSIIYCMYNIYATPKAHRPLIARLTAEKVSLPLDLAVDLTIVHPNPATGRPLRSSEATFLKYKGKQKVRESADS